MKNNEMTMNRITECGSSREAGHSPETAAVPQDRRSDPRYTVLDHRGWLTRWEERGLEVDEIRLMDVSRGGAAFEVEAPLPEGGVVVLGLERLREANCVEATVVRVTWGRREKYRVQVAFTESCSDEFFESSISYEKVSAPENSS